MNYLIKILTSFLTRLLRFFNRYYTQDLPEIVPKSNKRKEPVTHISAFTHGNAGDTILPIALRDFWDLEYNNIQWKSQHIYPIVDKNMVQKFNKTKGVIIGGGGLFLKDTNKNNISGWQWPCSVEMLNEIKVPIVLFSVGYNRFRNQEDFEPIFYENIKAFAKKAEYIGLRNYGSINALKNYIPKELHHKLRFQPCVTTFLSKIYPNICDYDRKENFVAINTAFDRSNLRFGENIGNRLTVIAQIAKKISKHFPIKFYSHMPTDEAFLPFLDAFNIKYQVIRLYNKHPRDIIKEYSKPKLVIGMRGHAQMIPFGCKTPIISIVSHNKMQWFVDDIGKPEWGIEIKENGFQQNLEERLNIALEETDNEIKFIEKKQKDLFELSKNNVIIGLQTMNLI